MVKSKNIYIMFFIIFFQGLVFYGPIATIYREARGINLSDIFIIESISWVLVMLLEVPWGWFADKFGYKKTLLISNFVFFISKIIFFKSYSFSMFLLERVFLSFSIAGLSGCDSALLYESLDKNENSERVFGMYNTFSTLGFLIACVTSYSIINISMDFAAFLTIIPYGISFIATLFISDTPKKGRKSKSISCNFKIAVKNKEIVYIIISFALISLAVHSVTIFLNQEQYIKSGIDIRYFGILLAVNQIIKLSASKSYKLSEKYGNLKAIKTIYLAIGVSCIILALTSNGVLSIMLILLISLGISLANPMIVDIENKSIITEDRATILSIYSMISSIISALISPLIGICANVSIELAFFICFIICIIGYILIYNRGRGDIMNYKKLISNGKSVRAFKNIKIEGKYFKEIESYIKKSKTLIEDIDIDMKVFSNEEVYDKLKNIAGYNGFMIPAPNYIVVLSDVKKGYLENSGYMGERIILKARDLGIDSCWITINDSKAIKEKLEIISDKEVTAIIALGYEDSKLTKNNPIAQRVSVNRLVYMNTWGNYATLVELEERQLLEAFNYARMSPSTLNRQPWKFIIDCEKIVLALRNDDFTTDYEKGIETGIAMLYFGLIIDTTMFDLKWSVGSIDKDYNITDNYDVVGYCSL